MTDDKSVGSKQLHASEDYSIYLGDVIEVLEGFEDESFDLVFADPPYFLSNGGFTVSSGRQVPVDKGDWDRSSGFAEDFEFHLAWLRECQRLLRPDGTLWVSGTYHSIYACGFALQSLGYRVLNEIAWFKPNAAPNLGRRMFTASHETLIWASRSSSSKHTFNYGDMKDEPGNNDPFKSAGKQMRSVWGIPDGADIWVNAPPAMREKTHGRHPTQKPEALLERVILASSSHGDLVLDPFCGSGTTGVAALRHGRRFVGVDSDRSYLESICLPRLRMEAASPRLSADL